MRKTPERSWSRQCRAELGLHYSKCTSLSFPRGSSIKLQHRPHLRTSFYVYASRLGLNLNPSNQHPPHPAKITEDARAARPISRSVRVWASRLGCGSGARKKPAESAEKGKRNKREVALAGGSLEENFRERARIGELACAERALARDY